MSAEEMKATVRNTAEEVKNGASKFWEKHQDVVKGVGLLALIFGVGYGVGKRNGAVKVDNYYVYYTEKEEGK